MPSSDSSYNSFCADGTNGRLDLSLSCGTLIDPACGPCKMWSGSLTKESVALQRQSSAGCMPERIGRWSFEVTCSDNAQSVIQNAVNETGVCTATLNWCRVLSYIVNQE